MSGVTPSGPHVRRSASATWRIKHRWGPGFGDVTDYTVTKREGSERVSISGLSGRGNENWPADLARELNTAINAALEWGGEDPSEPNSTSDDVADETNGLDTRRVTRVEVINETGRAFVQGPDPKMESLVEAVLQDEGRTLKVFINLPFDKSRAVWLTDGERAQLDRTREQIRSGEGRKLGDDENPSDFLKAQTRDNDGEILLWDTISEAFEYAEHVGDIWKISFNDSDGRRVRLVRTTDETGGPASWMFQPMEREIAEGLKRERSDREGDN